MRLQQAFGIVVAAFAFAGCVSYGTIEQARTITAPSCCSTIRNLPYVDLPVNQKRQFDLDLSAPSFEFTQGLSRFVAVRLPTNLGASNLWLKTFWIGNLGPKSFVLRPTLTFLDGSQAVIGAVTPKVVQTPSFMVAQENLGWEVQILLPENARFVVIHTDRNQLGSRLYIKEGVTKSGVEIVPTGSGPIIVQGGWWDVFLPTAESGRIAVEVLPRK